MIPAALFLLATFVYPFLYGLVLSFEPKDGSGALSNYVRFVTDPFNLSILLGTLLLGVKATVLCLLFGYPIAWISAPGSPMAPAVVSMARNVSAATTQA